jgi:hypothetical protein
VPPGPQEEQEAERTGDEGRGAGLVSPRGPACSAGRLSRRRRDWRSSPGRPRIGLGRTGQDTAAVMFSVITAIVSPCVTSARAVQTRVCQQPFPRQVARRANSACVGSTRVSSSSFSRSHRRVSSTPVCSCSDACCDPQ